MLMQRSSPSLSLNRIYQCQFCVKRYKNKSPDHWANKLKKRNPANLALKHFDEFYKKIFKNDWPSIRIALLTQHKYVAVVNNFGDTEKTQETLENLGALNIQNVYNIHKDKVKEKQKLKEKKKIQENLLQMQSIEDIEENKNTNEIETKPEIEKKNRGQKIDERNEEENQIVVENKKLLEGNLQNQSLADNILEGKIDENRIISSKISGDALYDFIPATRLKGMEDYITQSDQLQYYRPNPDVDFKVVAEDEFNISPYLNVYSFPMGDITEFPSPRRGITGVYNYYCMDGGSLLPVLALGIEPYDKVLDMCASPGGKTLIALQTLYPELIVANDMERSKRLIGVLSQYIYDFNPKTDKRIRITNQDGITIDDENTYDKILVDVPCTNDRLSVNDDFNNVFNPMKLKYRLTLPEIQSALLTQALKLVKVGGSVVYSTCSLSPIQNDGVVHMALKNIWEETNSEIEIKDLSIALKPLNSLFSFASNIKLTYGHLVKPYLPANFGPLYFCKFDKIK